MNEPSADKPRSFESALAELEEIVRALEAGDISLEAALGKYEAGVALLKTCYAQLREAEQRILVLSGPDAEGKPMVEPFETPAAGEPEPRRQNRPSEY